MSLGQHNQCSTELPANKEPLYSCGLPEGAVVVTKLTRQHRQRFTQEEIQEIVRGYTEHGLTVNQLADNYSCHRTTISKALNASGVEITIRKLTADQVKEATELYQAGRSLREIAQEIKSAKTTVNEALIKAGIEMREAQRVPREAV